MPDQMNYDLFKIKRIMGLLNKRGLLADSQFDIFGWPTLIKELTEIISE